MSVEQQLLVTIGDVGPAAPSRGDEAESRRAFSPRGGDILCDRLPHERRHRPPVPARKCLELAFELRIDEQGRTFHITYASIPTPAGPAVPRGMV